jgi:hypothetical protein
MKTKQEILKQLQEEVAAQATNIYNQHLVNKSPKDRIITVCSLSACLGTHLKQIPALITQEVAEALGEFTAGMLMALVREEANKQSESSDKSDAQSESNKSVESK